MYPQKVKDLIPDIASKLNIPVEHLEMMVTGEFQAVKDAMGSWDHNMIFLERFGTFFFRVWKIENEVNSSIWEACENSDLILFVVDSQVGTQQEDLAMLSRLRKLNKQAYAQFRPRTKLKINYTPAVIWMD